MTKLSLTNSCETTRRIEIHAAHSKCMYIKYIIFSLLKVKYYNVFRILPTGAFQTVTMKFSRPEKNRKLASFSQLTPRTKGRVSVRQNPSSL